MRVPEEKILKDYDEAGEVAQKLRSEGKKIVFTNGCFDIIHSGHIKTFFEAKKHGDVLFVGINTDNSVRRIKGEKRPILPVDVRSVVVAGCEAVDFVVPFDEDTPEKLIKKVKPDVLLKGEDWPEEKIVGSDFVKKTGGKVVRIKLVEGISTTEIINEIVKRYCSKKEK